jgi:hypothetical protein
LKWEDIKYYIEQQDKVFVLDKKYHLYYLKPDNLYDLNFIKYYDETVYDTKVHINFNHQKYYLPEVNDLIPIPKHYEKWENIYSEIKQFMDGEINEFLNTRSTNVFYQIEKNGIGIEPKKFHKYFEVNWKDNSIYGNTVFGQYNLYNLTTRPSNAFNGVNFAALPKGYARESFEPNNYVLVEFDYSAYHPRIISSIIDYKFIGEPYDEVPKEVMFQNIYGGIREEYKEIPFFKKLNEYLDEMWFNFNSDGKLKLATITLNKSQIDQPTKNKLLSYIIQSYETYYNVITLERVLKLLNNKKTKIVLYTYDSILLDVDKSEIKELLPKIKQELEAGGFPTHINVGENYGALVKK